MGTCAPTTPTPGSPPRTSTASPGDLFATCADIVGAEVPEGAGEDSVSMRPLLTGETQQPTRTRLVHHSASGKFALRAHDWGFIDAAAGGDNPEPDWFRTERGHEDHEHTAELFHLGSDLAERHNLYAERVNLVQRLRAELEKRKGRCDAVGQAPAEDPLTE